MRSEEATLGEVVAFDEIVTCLPIVRHVLRGFDDERAFRVAREAMVAFPIVESPMPAVLLEQAAAF